MKHEDLDPRLLAVAKWHRYQVVIVPAKALSERMNDPMYGTDTTAFSTTKFAGSCDYNEKIISISDHLHEWGANKTLAHELGHVLAGSTTGGGLVSEEAKRRYYFDEVNGLDRAMHLVVDMWNEAEVSQFAQEEVEGLRNYQRILFP